MSNTLAIYSVISLEATEPELLKSFDNHSILEDWLTNNAERIGRFLVATTYVNIPSTDDED